MSKKMKNIAQSEVLTLREQISYQEGQVVSKTLTQNQAVSITLFSFAKGEEISTHESGGDAFVTCLDGIGKITIDGERRKRINQQTLKIKVLYRRPSTRVLCLQSPGKINSNASICFFD